MTAPIFLTKEQEKEFLINAESFYWENFAHQPLNIFDLGSWTLCFPGDISEKRSWQPQRYAKYKVDINDLTTCPRYSDQNNIRELWNEQSQEIMWVFGRGGWRFHIHTEEFPFTSGSCSYGVTASRFQNIEGVKNLQNIDDLTLAIYSQMAKKNSELGFTPVLRSDCFTKKIGQREWAVAKTLDGQKEPDYIAATALDKRTAITVGLSLNNSWFEGEKIPKDVERKYTDSFWDFLSQINIAPSANDIEPGSIDRSPVQVEKDTTQDIGW